MAIESSQFIDRKKEDWQSLSKLLGKIQLRGLKGLTTEELNILGLLYRKVSADLAYAKTYLHSPKLTYYLNNLVAEAHGYIYQSKPARLKAVVQFYRFQFPALFRKTLSFSIAALLIFFFFASVGFITASTEEGFSSLLISPCILKSIENKQMWIEDITSIAPLASSRIMTNNVSVTFSAFALGITLGIGTFYILALNGLIFGILTYLTATGGMALDFWSFVLPHGIIELMCIFIAGGAGLLLGSSLLLPGELKRKDALVLKAKIAVRLVLGCILPLAVAGIIEGFVSTSLLPPLLKLFFALSTGALFYLYLFLPFKLRKHVQATRV